MDLRETLIRDFGSGFDKQAEQVLNNNFLNNKDSWVKGATEDYIKYNVDPNVSLNKIASSNNLNGEQVKRLVEETNVSIYLRKYAGLRDSVVRDVTFPLADADKIITGSKETAAGNGVERNASLSSDLIKVASADGSTQAQTVVKVDCTNNYVSYEPSLWEGTIEKNAGKTMVRKTLAAVNEELINKIAVETDIVNKIATIGNAVIHYERLGESGQELLDKIAMDANWYGSYQTPVLRYINKSLELGKKASYIPNNFELPVTYSHPADPNPYSLGSHSLLEKKSAELVVNLDKLPENVSYDELITFAQVLKKEIDKNPPPKHVREISMQGAV
ncbi:MAG: hypothetical protein PHV03_09310 [Desulfitobacteriaceae bacterium]|nr:hypothetical protein [Desulfitobacteriaceae bacterium]